MSEHRVGPQADAHCAAGGGMQRVGPAARGERRRGLGGGDTPHRQSARLDVLVLNPPPPDEHPSRRAGRHRDGARWPQTALAQIGAVLHEAGYMVDVLDAAGLGMAWAELERTLWRRRPRYLVVGAATATITSDLRATFIGRAAGAVCMAVGAHVTALSRETLESYPTLDLVVRGEPELTVLEAVERIDRAAREGAADLPEEHAPLVARALREVRGVAYRDERGAVRITPARPLLASLDDLPLPLHHMLPWRRYRLPIIGGPYAFVHTSRGCPAACAYCVKHIAYRASVRHRSVNHVLRELHLLKELGVRHVHFEADLFTASRDFVYDLCHQMLREGLGLRWSCAGRPDTLDDAELRVMRRAGCAVITWGLESGSEEVLRRARRSTSLARTEETLAASRQAGIANWGSFVIGLPGETEDTIRQTIALAKRLPLDIALFQVATPYPGTPLYAEARANGWLRVERWEDLGAPGRAALDYPHLSAAAIERWARRAAREWSLRPGPITAFLKAAAGRGTLGQLRHIGPDHARWMAGSAAPLT